MTDPPHHREPAGTYRRRRLAVGAVGLVIVVLAAVGFSRCGAEVGEVGLGATGTTAAPGDGDDGADPGDGGPGATTTTTAATTTTTALVIPGFATPQDYLACVKERESRGDYTAVSPDGMFFGAYQIDQVTWNNTTEHAGLTYLYEVQPNEALPADQDTLAMALLEWQGTTPWAGDC